MPTMVSHRNGPSPDQNDGISTRLVVVLLCCAIAGAIAWRWTLLAVPLGIALTAFVVVDRLIKKDRR